MSLPTAPAYETHLGVPLPPSVTAARMRWIWGSGAITGTVIFIGLAVTGLLTEAVGVATDILLGLAIGLVVASGVIIVRGLSLNAVAGAAAPEDADLRDRLAPLLRAGRADGLTGHESDALIRWARADVVVRETAAAGLMPLLASLVLTQTLSAAIGTFGAWDVLFAVVLLCASLAASALLVRERLRLVRIARLPMSVEDELPA